MTLPTWPSIRYQPAAGSWQMTDPTADPIESEMNAGNVRKRHPAGMNIAIIEFNLPLTRAELATFMTWFRNPVASGGIANGISRWTMQVWLGNDYSSKVVQFPLGFKPSPKENGPYVIISMKLRVLGV